MVGQGFVLSWTVVFLLDLSHNKKRVIDRRVPPITDRNLASELLVTDFFPKLCNGEQIVICNRKNHISRSDPNLIGWTASRNRCQRHAIVANVGVSIGKRQLTRC
jgi:hypothetical protein